MIETEYDKEITAVEIELKNEKYFLEVENIKEIYVPSENIVPIPLADKLIVGVIDVRGDVYSIVSLRHIIYGEDLDYNLSDNSRILLLDYNNSNIALLVDSVFGVKKIPISIFNENKAIIKTNIDYGLIKLIGNLHEQPIILLDLDALILSCTAHLEKKTFKTLDSMPKVLIQPEIRPKVATISHETNDVATTQKPAVKKGKKTKVPESEEKIILTLKQQDLLKEIGNIGVGNAVTALSKLIKQKIDVSLTDVGIISSDKLAEQFGGIKKKVCGIFCHIKAPSQSTILNIFEMKPLLNLVTTLAGKDSKIDPNKVKSKEDLDNFAVSTIVEMGNIMAGHYASALADLLGLKIMIDVPEFAMTDAGLLGKFISDEMKSISKYIVLIKTSIKISDSKMSGAFFFIPDLEALDTLFQKLGIKFEKEGDRKITSDI